MAPRGVTSMTFILLCFTLSLLIPAPAVLGSGRSCCTSYSRKPIPFQRIKGYREQPMTGNCRIPAIIFYTSKNIQICTTEEDEWVRKILELLSLKLKRMSKSSPAAGETPMRKRRSDGSGSFIGAPGTFPSSTESF